MLDNFDPADFRAPLEMDLDAVRQRPSKEPLRPRNGETFLKGPIPWAWLQRAMQLKGKALHVALMLWREAGMRKRRTVRVSLRTTEDCGLSRWTARRGLRALASAQLVTVTHQPGQALEVTLLETPVEDAKG